LSKLHRARHAARRVRQTLVDFDNGPALLTGMSRGRLTGSPAEIVFRVDGLTITVPNRPGARVPVYEVFAEDAYRLDWFTGDLGYGPTAVDIGAHIGCFAMAFALEHRSARVECFEASPATATYLERNISANRLSERVTTHATAVSSSAGDLELADNEGGSSLNGLTAPEGATIKVPCITVAMAFEAAGGAVDVVKIDTEGAEYDMVLASDPATWSAIRRVVLEYHDVPGHSWQELEAFFDKAGLTEVAHEPATPRQGTVWLSRDRG
jgi:FkbM family methyltransferase